jgi:hypothetical protein
MADVTMGEAVQTGRGAGRTAGSWVAAVPGVVAVVAFVVGFVLYNSPNDDASNKEWLAWYADRGHRIAILITGYLMIVAGIALVVFFTRLYGRVSATGATDKRDPLPLVLAAVAGTLFAAGGLVDATIPGGTVFGNTPIPADADILRLTTDIGFVLPGVGGMFVVAATIFTITRHARRSGYFGRALSIFGYVATVAGLAGAVFFPIAIVLIWVLVVSVVLARRPAVA